MTGGLLNVVQEVGAAVAEPDAVWTERQLEVGQRPR